ncbi:Peroxisomal membrane protein MPV17 [Melia azedarach]|uniref:Peroxisomal membrane protein MPV17 n=1 Tax=Melia azedarach TaxID=155640 RepID=A0ACC1Z0Q1_MELAZ|nr:Peroxisomal membrane protein MPV17 [Melia azedarach]
MEALGGGGFLHWNFSQQRAKPFKSQRRKSKSSDSAEATGGAGYSFPLKQAATAGSLALTGDTIAQLIQRWRKHKASEQRSLTRSEDSDKDVLWTILLDHDWLRALRMTSYGFLLYGPGSYAWYQYLDHRMPKQTVQNLMLKVLLNQIVLGPCVIAVCFAWNNLWQGTVSELPEKYKKDALPTLLYGFRFWIPVSVLNFWVVPLQARVAFMSVGSIFWNFYLSSTMSK